MRLEVLEGTASIVAGAAAGAGTRIVDRTDKVAPGDKIVVSDGGIAELTLDGGVGVELSGARVTVVDGRTVALDRGKVLVVADGPVAVRSGQVTARSEGGIFRVDGGESTRVGVYKDRALLEPGTSAQAKTAAADPVAVTVATYHQVVVPAGAGPGALPAPRALQIDPGDRWDIRYLKDAIDIDARLANLSRGLEAQLGSGTGLDFYRRVLPSGFQVGLITPLAGDRKTDVLIGSLIAHDAASGNAGGPDEATAVAGVFGLWREGASWGLVAHQFGVGQSALFSLLLDSVNRANLVDQGRGPALGGRRPSPAPSPSRSTPGAQPSPQPTPQPSGSPQPSPGVPTPSPGTDVLKPVTDLLDQVVQGLLQGLLGPSPRP